MATPNESNESTQADATSSGMPPRPPVDALGAAAQPSPPPGYAPAAVAAPQQKKGGGLWRVITMVLLVLLLFSVTANVWMFNILNVLITGPVESTYQAGDSDERIVIVPVEGLITNGTLQSVRASLNKLREDPPAALILRVDSPGGGVGASDRILRELKQFQKDVEAQTNRDLPIIASFGSSATSGGYYVSMVAKHIVAEPTGITGSIGVIAQAFTVEKLMDKIGVTPEVVTSSQSTKKDMLNSFEAWTDADRDKLRNILDENYEQFLEVVVEGRKGKLTREEIEALATGEIFTAAQAEQNELVDEIGYLGDAIAVAAKEAGISGTPRVMRIDPAPGFSALGLITGRSREVSVNLDDLSAEQVRKWMIEMQAPRLMYWTGHGE